MNSATDATKKSNGVITSSASTVGGKEFEPIGRKNSEEVVEELTTEMEVSPELQEAGIEHISGSIELPPDVKKLGVTSIPSQTQSPAQQTPLPAVILPISDEEVEKGLHVAVSNAFLWLATWCMKKLKKAHILLKKSGGKVIRVKE